MLLLENHFDDLTNLIHLKRNLARKESKLRYTKPYNIRERFCGWHIYYIKRFNELAQIITINRDTNEIKELETKVK